MSISIREAQAGDQRGTWSILEPVCGAGENHIAGSPG